MRGRAALFGKTTQARTHIHEVPKGALNSLLERKP